MPNAAVTDAHVGVRWSYVYKHCTKNTTVVVSTRRCFADFSSSRRLVSSWMPRSYQRALAAVVADVVDVLLLVSGELHGVIDHTNSDGVRERGM